MIERLQGLSLEEKQRLYYNGSHCPYCGQETVYVDSIAVYQESHGMIYLCKDCHAWVGCHHGNSDQSYGFVARKNLRQLRHIAHKWFDPLWGAKVKGGMKKQAAQALARGWLAEFLGIDIVECHIGMFDEEQCQRTITECQRWWPSEEVTAARDQELRDHMDLVKKLGKEINFTVSVFELNGTVQMSLTSGLSGQVANYKPKDRAGVRLFGKKWEKVDDLETWLQKMFSDPFHPYKMKRKKQTDVL